MTDPAASRQHALRRARQALRCLPFRLAFYRLLADTALSSSELVARSDAPALCQRPLGSAAAEDHFVWLIRLGVLRREVDGQGLTERVRLTPLGREVLQDWQGEIPRAGLPLRCQHWLRRHRPRL